MKRNFKINFHYISNYTSYKYIKIYVNLSRCKDSSYPQLLLCGTFSL